MADTEPAAALFSQPDQDTDNVTDWCLEQFQDRYGRPHIDKDDIWEYLYGVMHAPDWRERYAADLRRSYPRLPFAENFDAFRLAGAEMLSIHADYGAVPEHDQVRCVVDGSDDFGGSDTDVYRIKDKMRWEDKDSKTSLKINERCRLADIPPEAHEYQVSGRSPLDWAVDQLQVKSYKVGKDEFGGHAYIADDVNGWSDWADDPFELIRHLKRLVWLSVRTAEIVAGLPPALDDTHTDSDNAGLNTLRRDLRQPAVTAG